MDEKRRSSRSYDRRIEVRVKQSIAQKDVKQIAFNGRPVTLRGRCFGAGASDRFCAMQALLCCVKLMVGKELEVGHVAFAEAVRPGERRQRLAAVGYAAIGYHRVLGNVEPTVVVEKVTHSAGAATAVAGPTHRFLV